ncbi:MAG TPA: hypothetical protein VFD58_23685 [Blastocatellia bacterium]|nr:hypothetical protein [Blastocatellia bacterium]
MDEHVNRIRENAAIVIAELGPLSDVREFGFNRDSVVWVEGFIERQRVRPEYDATAVASLTGVLGSFLGECLIAAAGGAWHWSEAQQAWSVAFPNATQAFPFAKVHKLFENGLEGGDSIVSFYDIAVEYLATGRLTDGSSGSQSAHPD